jgi:hypothetical protein
MTLTTTDRIDATLRLIKVVCGEEYGDYEIVHDLTTEGYAEPGYRSDHGIVVLGNWNPKRFPRGDDAPLTREENRGPRLAEALERIGVDIEWYDEWSQCSHCARLFRNEPDSYSWTPSYVFFEDACEFACTDCALEHFTEELIEMHVNNSDKALTIVDDAWMEAQGFERIPEDGSSFQNGWYPGQTDDPATILQGILDRSPEAEVVFLIDSTGQFDVRFSAWVRNVDTDENEEV